MSSPKRKQRGQLVQVDFHKPSSSRSAASHSWRSVAHPLIRPTSIEWHNSERLFCQVFSNSTQPMSITTLADGEYLDVNDSFLDLLGYRREEVIGRTSLELGVWQNSAQRAELVRILERSGSVRSYETTLRGKHGQRLVWLSSADMIELDGKRCILVISNDISERKRAEEALRAVSARLIKAQEEERNRIARELHDGLSQKLALLCVDLQAFGQNQARPGSRQLLHALSLRLQEASSDVHTLSRQLHPSNLDHLGLVPAVKSLCREMSGRRGVNIEFISDNARNAFDDIDKEIALTAYRVIQEALANIIKHAAASRAQVKLKRQRGVLTLSVTDSGKGFSVEEAKLKGRLGLVSMQERLRLANGELIIRSKPLRGTQIEARIPVG